MSKAMWEDLKKLELCSFRAFLEIYVVFYECKT